MDYIFEEIRFTPEKGTLSNADGVMTELDLQTNQLLQHFVKEPQVLLNKDQLIASLWPDKVITDHSLTVAISKLRSALAETGLAKTAIKTYPKQGYEFTLQVTVANERESVAHTPQSKPARIAHVSGILAISLLFVLVFIYGSQHHENRNQWPAEIQQAIYSWQQKSPSRIKDATLRLEKLVLTGQERQKQDSLLALFYSYKYSRYFGVSDCHIVSNAKKHIDALPGDSLDYYLASAALNFYFLRDEKRALETIKKAQALAPDDADVLLIAANIYSALNLNDEAMMASDRGAKLNPTSQIHLWESVWSRIMAGKTSQAREQYEQAVQFAEPDATIKIMLNLLQGENDVAAHEMALAIQTAWPEHSHYLQPRIKSADLTAQEKFQSIAELVFEQQLALSPDMRLLLNHLNNTRYFDVSTFADNLSLQNQTHLLWIQAHPIYQDIMSPKSLRDLRSRVWQPRNVAEICKN